MARLPRTYAPFLYGIIQAAMTTCVASSIATYQATGSSARFFEVWPPAWGLAWLTMLPIVILVSPLIQRAVAAVTAPDENGRG
jgi:hypothetical protein